MHPSMRRVTRGTLSYYICDRLPVRHAFTTKAGGVSTGHCAGLNLGVRCGDTTENVRANFRLLAAGLGVPADRMTLTRQVHETTVTRVLEQDAGAGLTKPLSWQSDGLITDLADTPLAGFYADCVVTLFYDPKTHTAGVSHAGWRGMAGGILPKTVDMMARTLGADPDSMIAVMGPSIHQECFETDADVPDAMERQLGALVRPFIETRGAKFHVDLQGVGAALLQNAGLRAENIIDSGLCTMCHADEFWSHRATKGVRGVQGAVICL